MKKKTFHLVAFASLFIGLLAFESCKKCKDCAIKIDCAYCQVGSTLSDTICEGDGPSGFDLYEAAKLTCIGSSGQWKSAYTKDTLAQEICSTSKSDLETQENALTTAGYTCVDK